MEEEILNDLKHQFVLSEEGEKKISELVKNSREWIGVLYCSNGSFLMPRIDRKII